MNALKKKLKVLKSKRGKDSPVQNFFEKILSKHNKDRAAYHGRQLKGIHVQRFLQHSFEIFNELESYLIEVDNKLGDKEETKIMCQKYKELCILLDYSFSLARMPSNEANNDIINKTKEVVKVTIKNGET